MAYLLGFDFKTEIQECAGISYEKIISVHPITYDLKNDYAIKHNIPPEWMRDDIRKHLTDNKANEVLTLWEICENKPYPYKDKSEQEQNYENIPISYEQAKENWFGALRFALNDVADKVDFNTERKCVGSKLFRFKSEKIYLERDEIRAILVNHEGVLRKITRTDINRALKNGISKKSKCILKEILANGFIAKADYEKALNSLRGKGIRLFQDNERAGDYGYKRYRDVIASLRLTQNAPSLNDKQKIEPLMVTKKPKKIRGVTWNDVGAACGKNNRSKWNKQLWIKIKVDETSKDIFVGKTKINRSKPQVFDREKMIKFMHNNYHPDIKPLADFKRKLKEREYEIIS